MTRERRLAMVVALAGLLTLAGCLGSPTQSGSAAPSTSPSAGEVLTVSKANQSRAAAAGPPTAVAFEDLSADRRDEFRAAIDGDVRDPSQWGPGTDVQYVRYEGTWYFVTVVVAN